MGRIRPGPTLCQLLSSLPYIDFSAGLLLASRSAELRQQRDTSMPEARRGEYARHVLKRQPGRLSFPTRRGGPYHFLIPGGMITPGEFRRDIAANDGPESAAFGEDAHINVEHEKADGDERGANMDNDGGIAEEAQAPRNVLREPENQAAEQQEDGTNEETPEEELL